MALIYDARLAYDLKVMTGVGAYLSEITHWNVYIEEDSLKDQRLPDLNRWEGDGIIADFDHPRVAKAVVRSNLPAVGFGSGYGWAPRGVPYYFTHNEEIASMAAEHLLDRGLRHFAFCGYPSNPINGWAAERERAFISYLKDKGFPSSVYRGRHKSTRDWASIQRALGAWLASLPKPVGLMAANDNRGRQVLEACRARNIRVPQEVAVIGVDNDELLCLLSSPHLTSVEQGAKRLGYQAAALLDEIMSGKESHQRRFIVDPVGIVARRSTEILAVDDPGVARAMAFISLHASDGIRAQDVVNEMAISRSSLEARLRRVLGCTLHTAIRQAQLECARRLIIDTDLPLKQVAANAGFRSVQHMTTLFGRTYRYSPAKYRQEMTLYRLPAK